MIRLFSALILIAILSAGAARAIEVRNVSGQIMEVEVQAYTKSSGNVRIKRLPDGQLFNVKIDLFDEASQKAIREAAPVVRPQLEVKISVGRQRAREPNSSYAKSQDISVTVKVKNRSRDIDMEASKFTVLLFGRNMLRYSNKNADTAKLLLKKDFTHALAAGESLEFECPPVTTHYDSDRDSSNIGGFEYDGYLMVVRDAAGKITETYSNMAKVKLETIKDPALLEKAIATRVGTEVKRNLQPLR